MSYMFVGCDKLSSLPDISKWNISNVSDINFMLSRSDELSSLPDISKWNTKNVILWIIYFLFAIFTRYI